ncbi:MAG: hypothetical protein ACKOOI_00405, partial [Pirellula sp.]
MRRGCLVPIAQGMCMAVVSRLAPASGIELVRHRTIETFAGVKPRPMLGWVWCADEHGLFGRGLVG